MKNNMMKKLLTLTLACAMTLSLAACGSKAEPSADSSVDQNTAAPTETDAKTYKVAVIKQLDHASLDEIANAVTAELDQISADKNVKIEYEVTSGQGDQTILKQLSDQAIADGVDAIIPIATTAAQIAALSAEETKTPVVYAAVSDPETAKLTGIDYVTGTSDALNTDFIMDMMFAQNPNTAKVGLLYSLSEPNSAKPIADAKAIAVVDHDIIAITTGVVLGDRYRPRQRGADGCAGGNSQIHAAVPLALPCDGIDAVSEFRGDAALPS